LKRGLHLGTKIKLNECLDMGTEGVYEFIVIYKHISYQYY